MRLYLSLSLPNTIDITSYKSPTASELLASMPLLPMMLLSSPDFGNASPLKSPFCKCLKISIGNWANLIDWPILIVLMVFGVHKSHCWRGLRIANLAWKFKFGSYKRISEHQKWLFDHYKNALRHPNHPLLICNILIISIAILEMS